MHGLLARVMVPVQVRIIHALPGCLAQGTSVNKTARILAVSKPIKMRSYFTNKKKQVNLRSQYSTCSQVIVILVFKFCLLLITVLSFLCTTLTGVKSKQQSIFRASSQVKEKTMHARFTTTQIFRSNRNENHVRTSSQSKASLELLSLRIGTRYIPFLLLSLRIGTTLNKSERKTFFFVACDSASPSLANPTQRTTKPAHKTPSQRLLSSATVLYV
jgi:hypothetical protein